MFDDIGLKTAEQITSALPGVEKTISDAVLGVQVLVTQTIVPILADVVSQSFAEVDRLDGATVDVAVEFEPIVIRGKVSLKVSMPLKPEK